MFVYLPFAAAGLILPVVHTLCLPVPIVYPLVLSEAKQRGECGAFLLRSDSEGSPLQTLSL